MGTGRPPLALAGVALLHVSLLLGAVDGELARARDQCTWRGVYLDYLATRWWKPALLLAGLSASALVAHPGPVSAGVALAAALGAPPFEHAARHWLWVQRWKATDDVPRAIQQAVPAGPPVPEGKGGLFVLVQVADGHPYALTHLLTVAVAVDAAAALPLRAQDVLLACLAVLGPALKLPLALAPARAAELEEGYRRALVEVADPAFVNYQRVDSR